VHAEVGVAVGVAVLDHHVVANLPADPVAVVVSGLDAPDEDAAAILKPEVARVVAVQRRVRFAVAVDDQEFDRQIRLFLGGDQRKQGRHRGCLHGPDVLSKRAIEFEPVPAPGDQGAFQHFFAPVMRVVGLDAYPVANLKPRGVGQRDFLVEPVGIRRDGGLHGGFLDENRRIALAEQTDSRGEVDGVSQAVRAGQDVHGAAAQTRQVVRGGLDRLLGFAGEVGAARSHGDDQALFPIRLHGQVSRCRTRAFHLRHVRCAGPSHPPPSCDGS